MLKRIFVTLLAIGAMLSGAAMAADTIKGLNPQGKAVTEGTHYIFAVKSSGGVLSYRSIIGGGTVYTMSDSNGSQYAKALASFGTGNALGAAGGWVYDLSKVSVLCYNPQTTSIAAAGVSMSIEVSDNCTFANQAASQ